MNYLDDKGNGGCINSVKKLSPALVRPRPTLHQLIRTDARECLHHDGALAVAIHLQPVGTGISTCAGAKAASEGVVVHEKVREGGTEAVDRDSLAEDVEVLDGEAKEALLVKVRQVEPLIRRGAAGGHQHRLCRVVAVRYFY